MKHSPPSAPLVSIVIPNFNQGRYLPACLDHCLFQTYHNLEIIIVDGGSTDGTKNYLTKLKEKILSQKMEPVSYLSEHDEIIRKTVTVYPQNRKIKIVFGGPVCSFAHEKKLMMDNADIDYIVLGEGEETLAEIAGSLDSGGAIPGCIRRIDDEIIHGDPRPQIDCLDELPFPDYDHFDFNSYMHRTTFPILFTRGCAWNCTFCISPYIWKQFKYGNSNWNF